MKRTVLPTALVVPAMLVAACSSPSGRAQPAPPTNPAAPKTTSEQAGYPSTPQLQATALTASDLPLGWAQSPPSTDSSVTAPCPAINANATADMPAHVEVDFQQSEDGPFLQEILAAGPAQRVDAAWASFQTAANRCSGPPAGAPSSSSAMPTRLTPIPFPSYGDETYALQLTADRSGVTYQGDVIVIRKGQVLVEVVAFGVGGMPTALIQQLVGTSLAKL